MNKYRTHLILPVLDRISVEKLSFGGMNISLEFEPEPTGLFWETKDGSFESHYMSGNTSMVSEDEVPQKQLIIVAENEDVAEDCLSLIHGGMVLAMPDPGIANFEPSLDSVEELTHEDYQNNIVTDWFSKEHHIAFGCHLLKRVYGDKEVQYAIEKYKISIQLDSFNAKYASPRHRNLFDTNEEKKQYHVRAGFAINAAFSVVEELGLEVRSSSKKHRFLNPEEGEWNPAVYKDICERLAQIGISEDDTIDWVYRGEKSEIEKDITPYFGKDSQWVKYGEEIRDQELTFPEAIHNASYLRNFITAHKFRELPQFLHPYDVFNVQDLARQLILRKVDLWKVDVLNPGAQEF